MKLAGNYMDLESIILSEMTKLSNTEPVCFCHTRVLAVMYVCIPVYEGRNGGSLKNQKGDLEDKDTCQSMCVGGTDGRRTKGPME